MADYRTTDGASPPGAHADVLERPGDPDFMQSLARGLAVLRAAVYARGPVSVAELAHASGLPRSAVRRCVHTLSALDYLAAHHGRIVAGPRVASLAAAYSGSSALILAAQPVLDRLRDELRQTISMGILDGGNAVYLARALDRRRWHTDVPLGGHVPAYCTALGRVMLAALDDSTIADYLARVEMVRATPKTVTSPERLLVLLGEVRTNGYAVVDQELEVGLRAIAVPVRDALGTVVAAINVATQASVVGMRDLRGRILVALRIAAQDISVQLD